MFGQTAYCASVSALSQLCTRTLDFWGPVDTEMTFPVASAVACDYVLASGKWTQAISFSRETGCASLPLLPAEWNADVMDGAGPVTQPMRWKPWVPVEGGRPPSKGQSENCQLPH